MTKEQLETLKRIAEPLMEGSKYRDAIEAAIEVIEPIMAGFGYADPKQAGIKKDKFNDGLITRESVLFGKMNTKPEDMSEYQKGWNDACDAVAAAAPAATDEQVNEYCNRMCMRVVTEEYLRDLYEYGVARGKQECMDKITDVIQKLEDELNNG